MGVFGPRFGPRFDRVGQSTGVDVSRLFSDRKDYTLRVQGQAGQTASIGLVVSGKTISAQYLLASIVGEAVQSASTVTSISQTATRSRRVRKSLRKRAAQSHDYE